jgi:sugar (pentulose or hexulose) kinase
VCLGTAILAGTGAGKYSDIPRTVEQLVHVAHTVEPDSAVADQYRGYTKRYRLLYTSLASLRKSSADNS